MWQRVTEGRDARLRWYAQVADRLRAVGFDAPIVDELRDAAYALGEAAAVPER